MEVTMEVTTEVEKLMSVMTDKPNSNRQKNQRANSGNLQ